MKDRLETATTVRCVPWKVAAPVIRQSVCAAPAPGLWQREDFYFSKSASIPLGQFGGNNHRLHNELWLTSPPPEACEEECSLIRM